MQAKKKHKETISSIDTPKRDGCAFFFGVAKVLTANPPGRFHGRVLNCVLKGKKNIRVLPLAVF